MDANFDELVEEFNSLQSCVPLMKEIAAKDKMTVWGGVAIGVTGIIIGIIGVVIAILN